MNPEMLYSLTVGMVGQDGVISAEERPLLDRVRDALGLAPAWAAALERRVLAHETPSSMPADAASRRKLLLGLIASLVSSEHCLSPAETRVIRRLAEDAGIPHGELASLLHRALADALAGRSPAAAATPEHGPGPTVRLAAKGLARAIYTDMVLAMYVDLKVDARELDVLEQYRQRLGLSLAEGEEIVAGVRRGAVKDFAIPEGEAERRVLYRCVRAMAEADGEIRPPEKRLLQRLAAYAGLPAEAGN
ncbi:MAG: hypothetical protein HYZ53_18025 [Planctomycetes bacterium]|nr:hypothetical protein [Planctomycetota bacterium]